jgi:lysophospholipase L1-like esterase
VQTTSPPIQPTQTGAVSASGASSSLNNDSATAESSRSSVSSISTMLDATDTSTEAPNSAQTVFTSNTSNASASFAQATSEESSQRPNADDSTSASAAIASSASESGTTADVPLIARTVFLAGDSTVSQYADTASVMDQAGWGQVLHEYLDALATVDNRAIGGRTARRFIDEGALTKIGDDMKSGDVLMVQFGTNDGNRTATYELDGEQIPYYLDPETDFKTYLDQYIELALRHDSTPILVTPPPRNSAYCSGGNGTGAHAEAMRALGAQRGVAVIDLNKKSVEYLQAICPAPTPEDFFLLRADGSVDGTHFQEHGARLLAGFVALELLASPTPLAAYVL